jgi:hypothetical protein
MRFLKSPLTYGILSALTLSACDIPQDTNTNTVTPDRVRFVHDALHSDSILTTGPGCYEENYTQPRAQRTDKLDLLLVLDTSASLFNERARVAHRIDRFIKKLPENTHYRIGILLAHGKRSPWSGRLYYDGLITPTVFDSKLHSVSWIRLNLKFRLMFTPYDYWSDGGEAAFYSLHKILEGKNLERAQKSGFFRSDAALSVVFVSDENEICSDPPPGINRRKDADFYKGQSLESLAAQENCTVVDSNGVSQRLSPSYMLQRLREFKGAQGLSIGAIVHTRTDIKNITPRGEDEYGYGYMDIVREAKGVAIDINDKDYASGLSRLGTDAALSMTLFRRFVLKHNPIEIESLLASVDEIKQSDASYNSIDGIVFLPKPGTANSKIKINYCLASGSNPPNPNPSNDESNGGSENNPPEEGGDSNNGSMDGDTGDPGKDGDGDLPASCTAVRCSDPIL